MAPSSPTPQMRIAQLAKQLESGALLDDLVASTQPPPKWRSPALARAAFLGSFDDARFHELIVPEFTDADFKACIALPGIERAKPLPDETYRLKDAVAAEHLEDWLKRQGADSIRKYSQEVLAKVRDSLTEVERLRFLVAANPSEALPLFDKLFDEADRQFDLARCHELVQILSELDNFQGGGRSVPLKLLSPELRDRCDTLGRYVAARGRFIEEYSKSANFLERDELVEPTRNFLENPAEWLLTVYGRGGIGKTMFLRWLIARQAIPRPRCLPVARIDFDEIDIRKLASFPALIFIHFAEQLNRLMPHDPFKEYLDRYGAYAVLLVPRARVPPSVNVSELESEFRSDPRLNEDLTESFAGKLSMPAIVVLDTLEEGVLHFPDGLRAALKCLRSVHDLAATPSQPHGELLKVLLSGRYDLKARGFLLESDPDPIELRPLSPIDAKRLLCEVIGLEPSELVDITVRKANGNPFILSLIAQLIQSGDVRTVEDIDELKPDFAYLIKRIINRIPDSQRAIRWVIRYGVVPRSLTPEFLDAVMRPHLERELVAGQDHRDRIQEYPESFPRAEALDVKVVWESLRQYADTCGWLRGESNYLRFQPEVVRPMRALLRDETTVFADLQKSAVAWFSARADQATSDDEWARHAADEHFHRFAGDDPAAEARWQEALGAPRAQNVMRRRVLLEAVTDLLDREAIDQDPAYKLPVAAHVAAYALREVAKTLAGIGFGPVPDPEEPGQIAEFLRLASKISPNSAMTTGDHLVRMAIAVASRDYGAARGHGAELEKEPPDSPAEVYTLQVLLARAYAPSEDAGVSVFYRKACSLLDAHVGSATSAAPIWMEYGRWLRDLGDWTGALATYSTALRRTKDMGEVFVLRTDIAEVMLDGSAYDAALASISVGDLDDLPDPASRIREQFRRSRITALCALAHGRLEQAERTIGTASPAANDPLQQSQMLELQGELAAAKYNPRTASRLFEQACQRYSEARHESDANKARLKQLRVLKDQVGDWRRAGDLLERFNMQARFFSSLSPFVAIEAAQLAGLSGKENPSFNNDVFASFAREKEPEKHIEFLLLNLARIEPDTARYPLLKILAHLRTPQRPTTLSPQFVDIVPVPQSDNPDFFPHVFGAIELLRFLGTPAAGNQLQAAFAHAQPHLLPALLDAAGRLKTELPPLETLKLCLSEAGTEGYGFAAGVKYVRDAFDRAEHKLAVEAFGLLLGTMPEELRGTQIEAQHNLNASRLPGQSQKSSRQAVHRAAEILRQLGQDRVVSEIVGPLYGADQRAGGLWSRKPRATIALQDVYLPWVLVSNRELVPYDLAKQLAGPSAECIPQLRQALAEWELTPTVGVELSIDEADNSMLPWEWALRDQEVCFRSSTRIPDPSWELYRYIGVKLHPRLRQFMSFFRSLRVVILRPPTSSQELTGRGFEHQSRRPLTQIYAGHGVKAIEPAGLEPEQINAAIEKHQPDVIHIQAAVVERRRSLQLDLPLQDSVPNAEYLVHQLKTTSNPLVILDPPRPLEDVETARQLLLRNRFAAELIVTGRVRAVLAAGLLRPTDLQYATERLANRLGAFPLLRELVDLFRRDLNPDRFSSDGVALFARDPDDILVRPQAQ